MLLILLQIGEKNDFTNCCTYLKMIPITQLVQGEGTEEGTGFIHTQLHKETPFHSQKLCSIERILISSE
jgi:hypothetical protein